MENAKSAKAPLRASPNSCFGRLVEILVGVSVLGLRVLFGLPVLDYWVGSAKYRCFVIRKGSNSTHRGVICYKKKR